MDRFVVIGSYCYRVDHRHDICSAQDALAETDENVTPIFECANLVADLKPGYHRSIVVSAAASTEDARFTGEKLTARRFYVVPFTRIDSDNCSHALKVLIRARSIEHAHELVASRHGGAEDDDFWSDEANESGDTAEGCGDDAFYKSWCCDCGEAGCEDEGHEVQTEHVQFHFREAKEHGTQLAAGECGVEVGL